MFLFKEELHKYHRLDDRHGSLFCPPLYLQRNMRAEARIKIGAINVISA
jgi:hypothetical protein